MYAFKNADEAWNAGADYLDYHNAWGIDGAAVSRQSARYEFNSIREDRSLLIISQLEIIIKEMQTMCFIEGAEIVLAVGGEWFSGGLASPLATIALADGATKSIGWND